MSFSNARSYNPQSWAAHQTSRKRSRPEQNPTPSTVTARDSPRRESSRTPAADQPATIDLISSPTTPRSRPASRPASPPTDTDIARPTSSNTSAKRSKAHGQERGLRRPSKRRTRATGSATNARSPASDSHCILCGTSLEWPRYKCQDCQAVYLCTECLINNEDVHPGHKFSLESRLDLETHSGEPGDRHDPHDRAHDAERPEGPDEPEPNKPDEPRERHDSSNARNPDSHDRTPQPATASMSDACGVCRERLLDMCYECGQCARGFCARCVAFHPKDHVLQTVFKVVNSDESGGEGRAGQQHGPSRSAADHDERSSDSRSDVEVSDLPASHDSDSESDVYGSQGYISDSRGSDEVGSDGDGHDDFSDSISDNADRNRNRRRGPRRATVVRVEIPHNASIRNQNQMKRDITAAVTNIVQRAASQSASTQARSHSPNVLLDFDINIASNSRISKQARNQTQHRRWTDRDRRRLARYMGHGLSLAQIALKMKRTESAISQQWRKQ